MGDAAFPLFRISMAISRGVFSAAAARTSAASSSPSRESALRAGADQTARLQRHMRIIKQIRLLAAGR